MKILKSIFKFKDKRAQQVGKMVSIANIDAGKDTNTNTIQIQKQIQHM